MRKDGSFGLGRLCCIPDGDPVGRQVHPGLVWRFVCERISGTRTDLDWLLLLEPFFACSRLSEIQRIESPCVGCHRIKCTGHDCLDTPFGKLAGNNGRRSRILHRTDDHIAYLPVVGPRPFSGANSYI